MAYTIGTTEPTEIRGGDVVKWTKSLGDYLPATWTLIYTFLDTDNQVKVTGSDNGDGTHLVEMTIANTQALDTSSGAYNTVRWSAQVNDGTDYHTVGTGTLKVKPDLVAATSGFDDRSHVKKVLDLIEAVIEGSAERSYLADSVGDRSVQYKTDEELIVMRSQYKRWYEKELQEERIAQGLGGNKTVRVRF
jgi:hypothetical protein